jgi:hypothetical protein
MSCLYSSPDVKNLKSKASELASDTRHHRRAARFGRPQARRITAQFSSTEILPYVAISKDAFPTAQASAGDRINRLAKQAQVSCVSIQAQYQAFVRFAVRSSAALSAIALDWTCVLEPFTRGGLSL